MYGLQQAGVLVNELLEKCLNQHGYFQSIQVPGLWNHKTRSIMFSLIVDDFGVKCVGKKHVVYLKRVLEENYKVTWNYSNRQVHLYLDQAMSNEPYYNSNTQNAKNQNQPFPHTPIQYGTKSNIPRKNHSALLGPTR
ncbi:hypothetical protein ACHAW6_001842 [Cyclotella cf. meneghiniana]